MTLEELLRTAARDVADQAPDHDVAPTRIRSRAQKVRHRRRLGVAAGLAASTVLVAVGLQAFGGSKTGPEPIQPAPSNPTTGPTSSAPGSPVVTVPEINTDDLRDYEELVTVTNTQGDYLGLTELSFEVPVRDRFAYEWSLFCSGDKDTWYVLIVGDGGGSASGHCSQPAPQPFPTLPASISPFGHSGDDPATVSVRMFVTGPIPQQHLDCFEEQSPADCQELTPPLEPLSSTDVSFGVSLYEYWAPAVAEAAGQSVSARASVDGVDHVLRQVITRAPGQAGLATTLPATSRERLVAVVDATTDATLACVRAASSTEEEAACLAVLELRIGNRTVLLERGEFGDFPMLGAPHGLFRVPPGADQEIEVRVASGDPGNVDLALLLFEETP